MIQTSIIFVTPAHFDVVDEIESLLEQEKRGKIYHVETLDAAIKTAILHPHSLIVIAVSDAIHLKLVAGFVTQIVPQIRSGSTKVVVISSLQHPELAKFLKKQKCEELIPANVKVKGLKVKLLRHLSLLERIQQTAAIPSSKVVRTKSPARETPSSVVEKPAVEVAEDCWILKIRAIRKVRGHWIIKILGPGPNSGRWIRSAMRAKVAEDSWDWTPHIPLDNPFVKQGRWTFFGKLPEHRDLLWTLISERPCLSYSLQDQEITRRFYLDPDGNLVITRNSASALRFIPLIKASLEMEIRVQSEAPRPSRDLAYSEEKRMGRELSIDLDDGDQAAFRADLNLEPEPEPGLLDVSFKKEPASDPTRKKFLKEVDSKVREKTGLFDEITDLDKKRVFLREAVESDQTATIWTRGQRFREDVAITDFSPSSGAIFLSYPEGMSQKTFSQVMIDVGAQDIMINANLRRAAIFFQQTMKKMRLFEKGFEIDAPASMFQVQRRALFRYRFTEGQIMPILLGNGPEGSFTLSARDISGGGVCLKFDPAVITNRARLSEGDLIPNIAFKIYGREIRCAGQVRWKNEWFAGIQFVDISRFDSEGVNLFVLEESFEYLRRFVPVVE